MYTFFGIFHSYRWLWGYGVYGAYGVDAVLNKLYEMSIYIGEVR